MFDNDGTLWCEKPMPIQLDFILRRLVEMAEADEALRTRQPWRAAYERDQHYAGDDSNVSVLAGGILAAFGGNRVEDFEARADAFLRSAQHPTLGRGYLESLPPLRTSSQLISPAAALSSPDLPPHLPHPPHHRIWSRTGRRPLLAAGNSNGDVPMPVRTSRCCWR